MQASAEPVLPSSPPRKQPLYATLWVQVTVAMTLAVVLGAISPERAIAMKPLGDAFIRLITMVMTLISFCTVVSGIAGMRDRKEVGRGEGKAVICFLSGSRVVLC